VAARKVTDIARDLGRDPTTFTKTAAADPSVRWAMW
jgi:hypothetical protein